MLVNAQIFTKCQSTKIMKQHTNIPQYIDNNTIWVK